MKSQKFYRVLYLYDHLKGGEIVNIPNVASLFEVDRRTIQRDISDIRCYLADSRVIYGTHCDVIVYNKEKGGYTLEKLSEMKK